MKNFEGIEESRSRRNPSVHAKTITGLLIRSGESNLAPVGSDPGNAILPNGVLQTANLEIGVPGLQPQVPQLSPEFRLIQQLFITRELKEIPDSISRTAGE
jgi:hypothetical protein